MNDFTNIKVDDVVYIETFVRYQKGYRPAYKSFYLPFKVDRVTKTLFIADGRRFKKVHGYEMGRNCFNYYARRLNEKVKEWDKIITVVDQTKEYNLFIEYVNKMFNIHDKLKDLNLPLSDKYTNKELEIINKAVTDLEKVIKDKDFIDV